MKSLRVVRVFINPNECLSHFLCEPELPKGTIETDFVNDSNYEVAALYQEKLPRTKDNLLAMLSAADVCPVDAFYIELQDGKIMNVWDDFVQKKINSGEIEWV